MKSRYAFGANQTATFEQDSVDDSDEFANVSNIVTFTAATHTSGGSKVVRLNQNYASGPSKSIRVYPGDKIDAEVWTYYEANSGYGTGSPGLAAMVTAIATGFGGVSGGGGESGSIYDGVNSALGGFGLGGNPGDNAPAAYLNYILFDQQYKVMDMGWIRVPTSAYFSKQKISLAQVSVKEAGFIFVYLSYEDQSNNYVYFDDFKVTHTKSNLIQGNEYYPFGMQTANSWTRESVTGNNYLANGGTELNQTSQLYDLHFRNYDAALGRMFQVDPMASKYGSITPYNYSLNNPTNMNDPLGDDVEPQPQTPREYICAMCWRNGNDLVNYMMVSGGGTNSMGPGWRPGGGGLASIVAQWNPDFAGPVFVEGRGWMSHGAIEWEQRKERHRAAKADGVAMLNWAMNAVASSGNEFIGSYDTDGNKFELSLPTPSELDRRFGPSFNKFLSDVFYPKFRQNAVGTLDFMKSIGDFFRSQNWQEVLRDEDAPNSSHQLQLAEVRVQVIDSSGGLMRETYPNLEYPPNGPRIIRQPGDAGVVFNPGVPGLGQIILEINSSTLIMVLVEFNYIENN